MLGGIRAGEGLASFADVIDRTHHEPGLLESLVGGFAASPLCLPTNWTVP